MKVKIGCSINFAGCDREEEIELPDDYTENEIEDAAHEAASEYLNWWYERIDDNE